ncbi:MAG: 16S rRNA (uracil(1498)-N(3))-methyltransferase, partial [Deltaproteobacteria bacterium]|nr:16S rRNA (uracil(1498)-N(3))-methyltransferase [Deltaproteobacteria bacterium]
MSYFYSGQDLNPGMKFEFSGEEARHLLSSRRVRPGERFLLQDPRGRRFQAELEAAGGRSALVRVLEEVVVPARNALRLTLMQALVKDKALELIIQKCTELGVERLVFFHGDNSTMPRKKSGGTKVPERWERIASEACKQCDRVWPPGMSLQGNLEEALREEAGEGQRFLLAASADTDLGAALGGAGQPESPVTLLVGPEGGLTCR